MEVKTTVFSRFYFHCAAFAARINRRAVDSADIIILEMEQKEKGAVESIAKQLIRVALPRKLIASVKTTCSTATAQHTSIPTCAAVLQETAKMELSRSSRPPHFLSFFNFLLSLSSFTFQHIFAKEDIFTMAFTKNPGSKPRKW